LRFFYDHAATGDKDHGCDKAKDSKKVPVHALGYILIVFEVIILQQDSLIAGLARVPSSKG